VTDNRMKRAVRKDLEDYKREMLQQQAKRRRETQEFEERQDKKYAAVEDCDLLRDPNFMWIHRALEKSGWSVSAMIKKIGRVDPKLYKKPLEAEGE